ncbi:hypothetical protein FTG_1439 [Francisella tularensis subsp. novicida FTG]|nr:hypothetical protein FTG_1439 [Francisella tularensis subsp. novicida FTG]
MALTVVYQIIQQLKQSLTCYPLNFISTNSSLPNNSATETQYTS